jgi:hypothetical protein
MTETKIIKLSDLLKCACGTNREALMKIYGMCRESTSTDFGPEDSHSLTGSSEIMKQLTSKQKIQRIKVKPINPRDPIPVESIHKRKYKPRKPGGKKLDTDA